MSTESVMSTLAAVPHTNSSPSSTSVKTGALVNNWSVVSSRFRSLEVSH